MVQYIVTTHLTSTVCWYHGVD